jgi:transmembrane sensor
MPDISLGMLSDAGAWLVRMSGPLRTAATEEGFQRWLQEDPLHRIAFQRVTEEWDEADRLKRYTDVVIRVPARARSARPRTRVRKPLLAVAALFALLVAGAVFHYFSAVAVATGVNELRVVTLDDGSRIHLNTLTRITVDFSRAQRRVTLDSGEALFEVARRPDWPFVVAAGNRQVRALGTAFLIRREADRLAVTLVEGKVEVRQVSSASSRLAETQAVLAPGERVTFLAHAAAPKRDRPELDRLMAWQQGKVAMDDLTLAAAVAEMNRYSSKRLILEAPQPQELRISGVFIAGQSMSFARALAQSYDLQIMEQGDSIVLSGIGRSKVSAAK